MTSLTTAKSLHSPSRRPTAIRCEPESEGEAEGCGEILMSLVWSQCRGENLRWLVRLE